MQYKPPVVSEDEGGEDMNHRNMVLSEMVLRYSFTVLLLFRYDNEIMAKNIL